MNNAEALRKRAMDFLKEARDALKSGRYNLSYFFSEQAVQLYLKSMLLKMVGDYPRTHHIRILFGELMKNLKSNELNAFVRENRARISSLEDAYIMARYTTKEYYEEDAEDGVKLAEETIKLIDKLNRR